MFEQIKTQAIENKWSRRQVKDACYEAGLTVAQREEIYAACGMAATTIPAATPVAVAPAVVPAPVAKPAPRMPVALGATAEQMAEIVRSIKAGTKIRLSAWTHPTTGQARIYVNGLAPAQVSSLGVKVFFKNDGDENHLPELVFQDRERFVGATHRDVLESRVFDEILAPAEKAALAINPAARSSAIFEILVAMAD